MNSSSAAWRLEQRSDTDLALVLTGDWAAAHAGQISPETVFEEIRQRAAIRRILLAAKDLGRWDSVLMTFLIGLIDRCRDELLEVDTAELPDGIRALLDLAYAVPERAGARREAIRTPWLAEIGKSAQRLWTDAKGFTRFLGEAVLAFAAFGFGRARFRRVDLWLNIQECGPSAVPIVTLISLLVGLVLAFVGAVQLALFGAQIYIADLVALGMTREMGALMTAIIMSGRTGAAFAAQIGTMNVNLEISALRVMGFTPMEFLVLPRMLALILVMPVLCLYADLVGIVGGGLVTVSFFDVSLIQYLHRTQEAVRLADFFVGLGKCAVFGVLIALAGCLRGMQSGRSASAVGDAATSAVVTSIVFIVVFDSIITLICNRLGI
jgi:phospholipid/cholesterol/gamma-HCH transport system permease protein